MGGNWGSCQQYVVTGFQAGQTCDIECNTNFQPVWGSYQGEALNTQAVTCKDGLYDIPICVATRESEGLPKDAEGATQHCNMPISSGDRNAKGSGGQAKRCCNKADCQPGLECYDGQHILEKRCWQVGSYGAGATTYSTEPDKWGGFVPVGLLASPAPSTSLQPIPAPSPAPTSPQLQYTPAPEQPQPAPAPSGDCVSSGPAYYAVACAALAASCEQYSFCKRGSAGSGTPSTVSALGACVSNDPNIDYSVTCRALEATCEQFSFCKRASSLIQAPAMHSGPARRVRRLRRGHVLLQQERSLQPTFEDKNRGESDVIECLDEDEPDSATSYSAGPVCYEA